MVMEASPSPQSVGREFVRQYYTLLNKAPAHLHRFYNNYSSFVHGGLDAPNRETLPVVGQKQIHSRIQQLNFRDCHAKISQVDSQATLGNGVVVQVTGELSNGGAPMRRFTQTFVLAAQSPKKYYVHNDIFRYQDLVFSDEDSGSRSEADDEEPAPSPYLSPPAAAAPLNGHELAPPEPEPQPQPTPAPPMPAAPVSAPAPAPALSPEPEPEPKPCSPEPEPPATPAAPVTPAAAPEPKTYANLLKSGGSHAPQPVCAPPAAPAPAPNSAPPAAAPQETRTRAPRAAAAAASGGDGGRRYSDSQQLFLGNLPHSATEEELRALFARFGPVAELRVHTKPLAAGAPRHPNYGFITYETAHAAAACLHAAPLYFPADAADGAGVKLNVEEKKARRAPRRPPSAPSAHAPPYPLRALYRR